MLQSLRERISPQLENLFLLGLMILYGLKSADRGVLSCIPLSVVAFICLGIKWLMTSYTRREWIWMSVLGGLALIDFIRNHNYTLLLTLAVLFAAKNVDLMRVFKWGLWVRVVVMALTVVLACTGVIENRVMPWLPKYSSITGEWRSVDLYCYGYSHPNHVYYTLFTIAVLVLIVYGEKVKKLQLLMMLAGLTAMMYAAFRVVQCRSGWFLWILLAVLMLLYLLIQKWKIVNVYGGLLALTPGALGIFSMWGVKNYSPDRPVMVQLDSVVTGRLNLAQACIPDLYHCVLGHVPQMVFDMGYIIFPFNYGWLMSLLILVLFIISMYELIREGKILYLIATSVFGCYFFSEFMSASITSNLLLLLLAVGLFNREEKLCLRKNR